MQPSQAHDPAEEKHIEGTTLDAAVFLVCPQIDESVRRLIDELAAQTYPAHALRLDVACTSRGFKANLGDLPEGLFDSISLREAPGQSWGSANDLLVQNCNSEFLFFVHPETRLAENAIERALTEALASSPEVAAWQLLLETDAALSLQHNAKADGQSPAPLLLVRTHALRNAGGFPASEDPDTAIADCVFRLRDSGYQVRASRPELDDATPRHKPEDRTSVSRSRREAARVTDLRLKLRYHGLVRWPTAFLKFAQNARRARLSPSLRRHALKAFGQAIKTIPVLALRRRHPSWVLPVEDPDLSNELPQATPPVDKPKTSEAPEICVIIQCTSDHTAFLRECLSTLDHQTCGPLHVILCAAGGSRILREFAAARHYRFPVDTVFVRAAEFDLSDLWQAASRYVRADFIAFLDEGHVLLSDHFSHLAKALKDAPSAASAVSSTHVSGVTTLSLDPLRYTEKQSDRQGQPYTLAKAATLYRAADAPSSARLSRHDAPFATFHQWLAYADSHAVAVNGPASCFLRIEEPPTKKRWTWPGTSRAKN